MPVIPPPVRIPVAINRLSFKTVCDFPPRETGELWPDGTAKVQYGTILFQYQTIDADGTHAGWTPEFTTAELTDEEVIGLVTIMTGALMRHAVEAGLSVDLTPVPLAE